MEEEKDWCEKCVVFVVLVVVLWNILYVDIMKILICGSV